MAESKTQIALRVAHRHSEDPTTTAQEREAILAAMTGAFKGRPGELAAKTLFHLREQRRLQMTLKAILEGIGK
ncbi:MAG: hypothetical protein Q8J78_04925 [Moraxellaceae bacterium]|nr:hypothetical protein [Moraxellaceae bacterium]